MTFNIKAITKEEKIEQKENKRKKKKKKNGGVITINEETHKNALNPGMLEMIGCKTIGMSISPK